MQPNQFIKIRKKDNKNAPLPTGDGKAAIKAEMGKNLKLWAIKANN